MICYSRSVWFFERLRANAFAFARLGWLLGLAHVDEGKITGQLAIRQVFKKNRKMARTDGPDDITVYTGNGMTCLG
jgi:hypothetical protein